MKPHPLIGLVDESAIDITCHGDLQIVQSGGGEGNSMWPTAALKRPWRFQTRFTGTVFEDLKAKRYPHLVGRVGHNVDKLANAFKWYASTRSIKVLQNLWVADDEILHQQFMHITPRPKASISFNATRHTLTLSKLRPSSSVLRAMWTSQRLQKRSEIHVISGSRWILFKYHSSIRWMCTKHVGTIIKQRLKIEHFSATFCTYWQ